MDRSILKLALIVLLLTPAVTAQASGWTVQDVDFPRSLENVTYGQSTTQIVRLLNSSNLPVTESQYEGTDWRMEYTYNGNTGEMAYLQDGYFYATFIASGADQDGNVTYMLRNTGPEGGQISISERLNDGTMNADIVSGIKKRHKADGSMDIKVNVTDNATGTPETLADVYVYFTNGTDMSNYIELGYNTKSELFSNQFKFPFDAKYDSTYVLNVIASGGTNSLGSESVAFKTYPKNMGRITRLNTSGSRCNNNSFFNACERGANIDVGFRSQFFKTDNAEMKVFLKHKDEKRWREIKETDMNNNNGLWTSSFEIPDINAFEYEPKVITWVNASIDDSFFTMTRNITSKAYKIRDMSSPTAYPGDSYNVQISFVKYFSLEPLNETRIRKVNVTIEDPNGNRFKRLRIQDFSYDETAGMFENRIDIPSSAESGRYDVTIDAKNLYGTSNTVSSGFNLEDTQVSFSTTNNIDMDVNESKTYEKSIDISSKVGSQRTLRWYAEGGIENITTVNRGGSISLGPSEEISVPVIFSVNQLKDYSGYITLNDPEAGYNKTIDVTLTAPECKLQEGNLCVDRDKWINVTANEPGYKTETINLRYLGDTSTASSISAYKSGNISEYLTVTPNRFTPSSSQQITFNYSVRDKGDFTGNIDIEGDSVLTLSTKLSSSAQVSNPGIDAPPSVDVGQVPAGEELERTLLVNNTGNIPVDSLSAETSVSAGYDVSVSSVSIQPGESKQVTFTLTNLESLSGSTVLTASTSQGEVQAPEIYFSGNIVNIEQKISDLETRISELQSRATTSSIQNKLNNAQIKVEDIRASADQGNLQEANQKADEVSATLDEVESSIESASTGEEPPGQQPGGGSPAPPTNETSDPSTGGGGGGNDMLIPIVVGVFVLILIGFIFYTSYVPEEGDPLYDQLGE